MMELTIEGRSFRYCKDVEETETDIWKAIGSVLISDDISVPDTIYVESPLGTACLDIKQRGTFVKNGEEKPSMYVTVSNNISVPPSEYKQAYLTCINPESNNYKFYHLKPKFGVVDVTYGRIGSDRGEAFGTKDIKTPYPSYLYWIRYYEKLSKGYTDQTEIFLAPVLQKKIVKEAASKSHPAASEVSLRLYEQLQAYARHMVKESLANAIVTVAQVKEAKKHFAALGNRKTVKGFNSQLMKLLTLSPRKTRVVGDLLARSERDFASIIDREENLLNAMSAVSVELPKKEGFESFGIQVFPATEKQKKEVMSHIGPQLEGKVKNIYRVIDKKRSDIFNAYIEKNGIKKIKQLWHGSRNENWMSIILNSLQLNPHAQIIGKMFGKGVYFAPSSMKSWGYTSYYGTYWANGRSSTAFMGLYATAYGNPLETTSPGNFSQNMLDQKHKNCVHALAGNYLRNDEIIFYNESAMVLNYIVEFGD